MADAQSSKRGRESHPVRPSSKLLPLVCPQCRAQYIPLRPTAGRRVKCRHCHHIWRDTTARTGDVAGALDAAATAWTQLGSTMLAAADHGSTMGRIAARYTHTPPAVVGEWIGKQLGRYEVRSVLGLGAMGHVYEGYDADLQRVVAMKILPRRIDPLHQPLGLRMFLQEARVAARIQHPNVVTVYEVGQQDGVYYFIMERIHGVTLAALIDRTGALPIHQACYSIAHAAKGLAAGHALGIVHRDVKPGNIMIDTHGRVKVTDFGLANVAGATGIKELADRTLGTPGWISPEAARGEPPTPASDIYSLGLTLYYALTNDRLVKGDSKSGMIRNQMQARSITRDRLPQDWPARLSEILVQCLQADPRHRYHSADQLGTDLLRAIVHDDHDGTIVLDDRSARVARLVPRWLGWLALAVAVGTVLVLGWVTLFR